MRKAVVLTAIMALAMTAAVFAMPGMDGDGPDCPMGMGMGMGKMAMPGARMILAMASELNLTAEQMTALKKLIDEAPDKKEMKKGAMDGAEELKAELEKEKPDQAKIDSIIDKIADAHKAKMKMRAKHAVAISSILTKEQKDILKKKFEDKKQMKKGKCPMAGK